MFATLRSLYTDYQEVYLSQVNTWNAESGGDSNALVVVSVREMARRAVTRLG